VQGAETVACLVAVGAGRNAVCVGPAAAGPTCVTPRPAKPQIGTIWSPPRLPALIMARAMGKGEEAAEVLRASRAQIKQRLGV